MSRLRIAFGVILLLLGVAAIAAFGTLGRTLMFLSPDRAVTPFMMQLLRIVLVSGGVVGLVMLLFRPLMKLLGRIDGWLVAPTETTVVVRLLVVAVLLRLAVILLMPFHLYMDYLSYSDLGWQWAQHGGYYNGEHLTAYWPPAYPYLLSRFYLLLGHAPSAAVWMNIILGPAIVLLAYLIARDIWGARVGRWTLLIMAVFPSQLFFTNLLASEMLFTPLFLLALWLAVRTSATNRIRWWLPLLVGAFIGLGTLTRAISKLYLIPVILFWLVETRGLKRTVANSILAIAGFAVIVVPWMARNYYAVGSFVINTNTGINLFIGNQPSSGMGYNQHAANEYDVNDPLREAEIDRETTRRAWQYIRAHPGLFLAKGVTKVGFFYAVDVDALDYGLLQAAESGRPNASYWLAFPTEIYYLLALLAGVAGLVLVYCRRSGLRRPGADLLLLTVLYWTGIHFVFYGIGRYHFPIIPLISAFAAVFLMKTLREPRKGLFGP